MEEAQPLTKYEPLGRFLGSATEPTVTMSFAQLEQVLGSRLPSSAYNHRAWWGNQRRGPRPHARAWMDAGWEVDTVILTGGHVTFRRISS